MPRKRIPQCAFCDRRPADTALMIGMGQGRKPHICQQCTLDAAEALCAHEGRVDLAALEQAHAEPLTLAGDAATLGAHNRIRVEYEHGQLSLAL